MRGNPHDASIFFSTPSKFRLANPRHRQRSSGSNKHHDLPDPAPIPSFTAVAASRSRLREDGAARISPSLRSACPRASVVESVARHSLTAIMGTPCPLDTVCRERQPLIPPPTAPKKKEQQKMSLGDFLTDTGPSPQPCRTPTPPSTYPADAPPSVPSITAC